MPFPDALHHHSWFQVTFSCFLKAKSDGRWGLSWLNAAVRGSDHAVPYLKDGDSEGVSQVMMGGQQHFAVVSVQIHAGQQMQLWVDPVQTLVWQVWRRGRKGERSSQEIIKGAVATPSIFCGRRKHTGAIVALKTPD